RAADAGRHIAGPALETGARALSRYLVTSGWLPRARRDARAVDSKAPGRKGRCARGGTPGTARDAWRPGSRSARMADRDGVPRPRADRCRSRAPRRYGLASGLGVARAGVRSPRDHARGP